MTEITVTITPSTIDKATAKRITHTAAIGAASLFLLASVALGLELSPLLLILGALAAAGFCYGHAWLHRRLTQH
ncbi:hypothetical protein [Nocardia sp. NPDC050435]|uniref:hypothetical protein n=1 Tax=Nocardia sp. NPDC050435 TaxID=3155040 RepID=UPI0034055909